MATPASAMQPVGGALEPGAQTLNLALDKGVDESQSPTVLPSGYLLSARNLIPEPAGGMRLRWAWTDTVNYRASGESATYPAASRKCRGIQYVALTDGGSDDPGGLWWAVTLFNPDVSDRAELWAIRANFTEGWRKIDDFGSSDPNWNQYPLALATSPKNAGNDEGEATVGTAMLYSHPSMATLKWWDGTIPSASAHAISDVTHDNPKTKPRPGRALALYKGRVYMGGSDPFTDNYTFRLYFSDVGDDGLPDFRNWPEGNYSDVGEGDGTTINALLSYGGALLIGKGLSVWAMTGVDAATRAFNRLNGPRAAKGRSLVSTPTGVLILGETDAWFWDGGDPTQVGQPVQHTYQAGAGSPRFGHYVGGKVFVSSLATGCPLMAFDPVSGAWTMEEIGGVGQHVTAVGGASTRHAAVPYQSTLTGPMFYRDVPHGDRGADPWFADLAPASRFSVPDSWLTHIRQKVRVERIWVRVRRRGSLGATRPTLTVRIDGEAQPPVDVRIPDVDGGVEWTDVQLAAEGRSVGLEFVHAPLVGEDCRIEPEEVQVDINVAPASGRR